MSAPYDEAFEPGDDQVDGADATWFERVLDGADVDAVPPHHEALAQVLLALRAPATDADLAGEAAAVAMFRSCGRGTTSPPARTKRGRTATVLTVAAAVTLVTATSVAAATGRLPADVQDMTSELFEKVGIHIPAADRPSDDDLLRSGATPPASGDPRPAPPPTGSAQGAVTERPWERPDSSRRPPASPQEPHRLPLRTRRPGPRHRRRAPTPHRLFWLPTHRSSPPGLRTRPRCRSSLRARPRPAARPLLPRSLLHPRTRRMSSTTATRTRHRWTPRRPATRSRHRSPRRPTPCLTPPATITPPANATPPRRTTDHPTGQRQRRAARGTTDHPTGQRQRRAARRATVRGGRGCSAVVAARAAGGHQCGPPGSSRTRTRRSCRRASSRGAATPLIRQLRTPHGTSAASTSGDGERVSTRSVETDLGRHRGRNESLLSVALPGNGSETGAGRDTRSGARR